MNSKHGLFPQNNSTLDLKHHMSLLFFSSQNPKPPRQSTLPITAAATFYAPCVRTVHLHLTRSSHKLANVQNLSPSFSLSRSRCVSQRFLVSDMFGRWHNAWQDHMAWMSCLCLCESEWVCVCVCTFVLVLKKKKGSPCTFDCSKYFQHE